MDQLNQTDPQKSWAASHFTDDIAAGKTKQEQEDIIKALPIEERRAILMRKERKKENKKRCFAVEFLRK